MPDETADHKESNQNWKGVSTRNGLTKKEKRARVRAIHQSEPEVNFFYLRNQKNDPMVFVCDLNRQGVTYRGLALCSFFDVPDYILGREISYGRALLAAALDKNELPVRRWEAADVLSKVGIELADSEMGSKEGYKVFVSDVKHKRYNACPTKAGEIFYKAQKLNAYVEHRRKKKTEEAGTSAAP
jgi:hypothetical protein